MVMGRTKTRQKGPLYFISLDPAGLSSLQVRQGIVCAINFLPSRSLIPVPVSRDRVFNLGHRNVVVLISKPQPGFPRSLARTSIRSRKRHGGVPRGAPDSADLPRLCGRVPGASPDDLLLPPRRATPNQHPRAAGLL